MVVSELVHVLEMREHEHGKIKCPKYLEDLGSNSELVRVTVIEMRDDRHSTFK